LLLAPRNSFLLFVGKRETGKELLSIRQWPVIRPEPRNLEGVMSALFGE